MNSVALMIKKNLKGNKIRNILIIVTIILTTALITTIGVTSISIQKMLQGQLTIISGNSQGGFRNVNDKQLQLLKQNNNIYSVGEFKFVGNIINDSITSPRLILSYKNESMLNNYNNEIEMGNMPTKSNEVVIERWVLDKFNIKPIIGTNIPFKYLKITGNKKTQAIESFKEDTFILSGIIKDNENNKENYSSEVIISKEFVNKNYDMDQAQIGVQIILNKINNIEQRINDIANDAGIKFKDVYVNQDYINANSIDLEVIAPTIIIIFIVIFSAFIVIYNVFHVSIVSKVQQFGLLAALGATPKQIKKIVIREGLILSFIGISLGVLLGCLLSFTISSEFSVGTGKLQISINPLVIVISVLISLFTVVISIRKPANIASKFSPIEAVRYSGTLEYKGKQTRKVCKQVSLSKLAYINLWRNKKKTIITMLSLTMSGILFIVFSTILSSMNVQKLVETIISSDFQLNDIQQNMFSKEAILDEALIRDIKNVKGVKSVNAVYYIPLSVKDNDSDASNSLNSECYGYDENIINELKAYLVKGNISIEKIKANSEVLLVQDEKWSGNYKVGQKVSLKYVSQDKEVTKEFTLSGIVSRNTDYIGWLPDGPTFITTKDIFTNVFESKKIMRLSINVNNNYEEVENSLKVQASKLNINLVAKQEFMEKQEKSFSVIKTAMMSLVAIIGLIAIINQINTMITSIFSRKKEIGILQAIAVTDKQLVRILQIEGLYYSVFSILIAVPVGSLLGYMFYTLFSKIAFYAKYQYPILNVILLIIVLIGIQIVITYFVTRSLRKESLVQRIQYSE